MAKTAEITQPLKTSDDFLDARYWDDLAKDLPYVMPRWNRSCTESDMEVWLHRFDLTKAKYKAMTGLSLRGFIDRNPTWPLRAFVGLLLEDRPKET